MAKVKLSSSSHNIFILSDSTESNPYKNQNERSRCTVCFIVVFTFAIGIMMGHQSSAASPYKDRMMQRTDNYDEEISSDNAKAWDAFVDIWILPGRLRHLHCLRSIIK
jgi:hypothetical protein